MKRLFFSLCIVIVTIHVAHSTDIVPTYAKNGMVVSASELASQVGIDILKKGGNAIDAAVATGFALAVTAPHAGNIGGGGFLVARLADGQMFTLDFRETAPRKAFREMYLDKEGEIIENLSLFTPLAAGVPGTVDGLLKVWETYGSGKISRRELLTPALKLAAHGFPLTHYYAQVLNNFHDSFENDDGAIDIFNRNDGRPWIAGDLLIQKDLAKTLQLIAQKGRAGFYTGKIADLIEKEMQEGNGFITEEDLADYSSKWREPVLGSYKEYKIISMGPPSAGGTLLVLMLNMLENFPLDTIGWNSSDYIHLLTEVERRAFADRAAYLGDLDFREIPVVKLTSKDYAQDRIADISMTKATPSLEIYIGDTLLSKGSETTHYSVVDADGNAVSVTTTLNYWFGCGVLVEGAGFFLNNEMNDFSLNPGVTNSYGFVPNEVNAIVSRKRMVSSMTPTIVLKENVLFLVLGSPGGSTIITTLLQIILNSVEYKMNIQEAVSAPRIHSQWLPDVIRYEPRSLSIDIIKNLETKGHTVVLNPDGYIGRANCIMIGLDGLYSGADPRGENSAVGY